MMPNSTYTDLSDYDESCVAIWITPTDLKVREIEGKEKEEDFEYYAWKAEEIRVLARLSRGPILPAFFFLVFLKPYLIRRKILRCNRHGIGLHMGKK